MLGFADLPPRVREEIYSLAKEFRSKGVELILFGSFAKKEASSVSDLDLAYTGTIDPSVESLLGRRIDELPTIRPIDLVSLDCASPDLIEDIQLHGIHLADG